MSWSVNAEQLTVEDRIFILLMVRWSFIMRSPFTCFQRWELQYDDFYRPVLKTRMTNRIPRIWFKSLNYMYQMSKFLVVLSYPSISGRDKNPTVWNYVSVLSRTALVQIIGIRKNCPENIRWDIQTEILFLGIEVLFRLSYLKWWYIMHHSELWCGLLSRTSKPDMFSLKYASLITGFIF